MVDEEQDPYASVLLNCSYSSSQDDLLSQVKFLHEGEKSPDNVDSPDMENSGASFLKFEGKDKIEGIHGGTSTDADADSARSNSLGFDVETQLGEPELKKLKVNQSVHGSGEKVNENMKNVVVPDEGEMGGPNKKILDNIDSQDMEDSIAACKDDIGRVHGARAKNLGFSGDNEVINSEEEQDKEEVEFGGDTELINVVEEHEKEEVEFGGDTEVVSAEEEQEKKEVKFGGGTKVIGVQEDEIPRKRKRELPRSMFGLTWDVGSEYAKGDVVDGLKAANVEGLNHKVVSDSEVESGLRKASVEGNSDCKSKNVAQKSIKCILEGLRLLAYVKVSNGYDNDKVDILETAKRRGMTFPRSRFLPKIEEDEKEG